MYFRNEIEKEQHEKFERTKEIKKQIGKLKAELSSIFISAEAPGHHRAVKANKSSHFRNQAG